MNAQYKEKRQKQLLNEKWRLFFLFCWAALFFGGLVGIIIAIMIMLGVLWQINN